MPSGATPRLRIEQACTGLGRSQVVRRCQSLLVGGEADPQFILTLGGPAARRLLDDGIPPAQDYWLRVWAARGLLWAGPGDELDVLRAALADPAWRVRELTCKVVARYQLGDLLDEVAELQSDPVPRVRRAALRAATRIVEAAA